jgi:hypothetical protein
VAILATAQIGTSPRAFGKARIIPVLGLSVPRPRDKSSGGPAAANTAVGTCATCEAAK